MIAMTGRRQACFAAGRSWISNKTVISSGCALIILPAARPAPSVANSLSGLFRLSDLVSFHFLPIATALHLHQSIPNAPSTSCHKKPQCLVSASCHLPRRNKSSELPHLTSLPISSFLSPHHSTIQASIDRASLHRQPLVYQSTFYPKALHLLQTPSRCSLDPSSPARSCWLWPMRKALPLLHQLPHPPQSRSPCHPAQLLASSQVSSTPLLPVSKAKMNILIPY